MNAPHATHSEHIPAHAAAAYKWVLSRVWAGLSVLDFGCGDSPLPRMLFDAGCDVSAIDRDRKAANFQALSLGGRIATHWALNAFDPPIFADGRFDVVLACWSLEHNTRGEQHYLLRRLGECLKPGGRLLVAASLAIGDSHEQIHRPDPRWLLNDYDHRRLIAASGLAPVDAQYFWSAGGFCAPCSRHDSRAMLICYELRKGEACC